VVDFQWSSGLLGGSPAHFAAVLGTFKGLGAEALPGPSTHTPMLRA
jgi:hypothetical protein